MSFLKDKPEPIRPLPRDRRSITSPPFSAESLNRQREMDLRQVKGDGDINVKYFGDRLKLNFEGAIPSLADLGNYIAAYLVGQEFADYLLCTPFIQPTVERFRVTNNLASLDGDWVPQVVHDPKISTINPVAIYIAKPYVLQQTPFNGQTIPLNGLSVTYAYTGIGSRKATDPSGNIEDQVIVPGYFPGDVILAIRCLTGFKDPNNSYILWSDLNTAARAWAAVDFISASALLATSIAVSCNPNPISSSTSFTIIGIVLPSVYVSTTPTGTVDFYIDNIKQGTGTISGMSGQAQISLSNGTLGLSVGNHNVQAIYSGDANFNPSVGTAVLIVN